MRINIIRNSLYLFSFNQSKSHVLIRFVASAQNDSIYLDTMTKAYYKFRIIGSIILFAASCNWLQAQFLPPESMAVWKSRKYMLKPEADHATPFEKSSGKSSATPDELKQYLEYLKTNSSITVKEITQSPGQNPVFAVFASTDAGFANGEIASKPVVMFQGGIHAGEIDGMDAGLMLMRDLANGRLRYLLEKVNIIFIPVINADGHSRLSAENRINQRGPDMMGWRTNSLNQNLNRDYMKLECPEVRAAVKLINEYDPDLYIDIHVTDGTDYQYDITYGWNPVESYSPGISYWMNQVLRKSIDISLSNEGHVPGPLIFQRDHEHPEQGISDFIFPPRFSNSYGDAIHLPTILVENHSLKSFDRRVCGTYVFLEGIIKLMSEKGMELRQVRKSVEKEASKELVLKRSVPNKAVDSLLFKGIEMQKRNSGLFNYDYVSWTGKPLNQKVPVFVNSKSDKSVRVAKKYIIPVQYDEIINKLRQHGIQMQTLKSDTVIEQITYKLINTTSQNELPFQGRMRLNTEKEELVEKRNFKKGAVVIETSQTKGLLAAMLLEPEFEDSFFSWGYFPGCTELTEYYEIYTMVPLAEKMAIENPGLKSEFEKAKSLNPEFANNPEKQIRWWYERSGFFDKEYLKYPVGIVR